MYFIDKQVETESGHGHIAGGTGIQTWVSVTPKQLNPYL